MKRFSFITLTFAFFILSACSSTSNVRFGGEGYRVSVDASGLSLEFSDTVRLSNNETDELEITSDGVHAFPQVLRNQEAYNVNIVEKPPLQNCRLSDAIGQIQGEDVTVVLWCDDRSWSFRNDDVEQLSLEGYEMRSFDLDMDGEGNLLLSWQQVLDDDWRVFKGELENDVWTLPATFDDSISFSSSKAMNPKVSTNDAGQALIAWGQQDGNNALQIMKCEKTSEMWTCPTDLEDNLSPDGTHARRPYVDLADNGEALISWSQDDTPAENAPQSLYFAERRNGVWSHPENLNAHFDFDGESSYSLRQAMNNEGTSIILWQQAFGSRQGDLYGRHYVNETWISPDNNTDYLSFSQNASVIDPSISLNDSRQGFAAWTQFINYDYRVYVREFFEGSWQPLGFSSDYLSVDGMNSAANTQISINNLGQAILVFSQQENPYGAVRIFKSEYEDGTWEKPQSVYDALNNSGQSGFGPKVAMDDQGNILVGWLEVMDSGSIHLILREKRMGAWFPPEDVTQNLSEEDTVEAFELAMSNAGNAIIVWRQMDAEGMSRLFASQFK